MDDIGPFVCKTIDCNISYTYGYDDYYINNIRDIVETKNTCKNINQYLKLYEEYIKDTVVRKLKNLDQIQITYCIFDKNNILHRLTVTVIEMLNKLFNNKEKKNLYKSIICMVWYEGRLNFIGGLNFGDMVHRL